MLSMEDLITHIYSFENDKELSTPLINPLIYENKIIDMQGIMSLTHQQAITLKINAQNIFNATSKITGIKC